MKMVKSLLLGSAAGMMALSGAQAASLPVKAKPVQYVKICTLYGAGFYYIPGTDTCIKIGGWVRAEYNINAGGSFNPFHHAVLDSRGLDFTTTRARGMMSMDARTQTEYGTLRAYWMGGWQWTNGSPPGAQAYAIRGFVQWAGFTFGRAVSFFDFYVTPWYSNTTNVLGSDTGGAGDIVFAYTAQLGNGLSASVSAEDTSERRTAIAGLSTATGTSFTIKGIQSYTTYNGLAINNVLTGTYALTANASLHSLYAGTQWPDIVGNLRIDQAWGSAQIMAAAHQVRSLNDVTSPHPAYNKVGWAIGGGARFNLPWGHGDSLAFQAAYTEGALKYIGSGLSNFEITDGFGTAWGPAYDAVMTYGNCLGDCPIYNTGMKLTTGWSVVAGADHHWNPHWKTSLYGTYGNIHYDQAASNTLSAFMFLGTPIAMSNDVSWSFWQIGSRTVWTPVPNLDLSVDVMYNNVDTATTSGIYSSVFGNYIAHGNAAGLPGGNYLKNESWWQAIFRVQRNFYP